MKVALEYQVGMRIGRFLFICLCSWNFTDGVYYICMMMSFIVKNVNNTENFHYAGENSIRCTTGVYFNMWQLSIRYVFKYVSTNFISFFRTTRIKNFAAQARLTNFYFVMGFLNIFILGIPRWNIPLISLLVHHKPKPTLTIHRIRVTGRNGCLLEACK